MRKIDDSIKQQNQAISLMIVIIIGIALQFLAGWPMMIIVGIIGALLVRRHRTAFAVGFVGITLSWLIIFAYLISVGHALEIANFFVGLLGLNNMGGVLIAISCIIGGLLAGMGGLLGRSIVEFIDEIIAGKAIEGE